LAQYDIRQENPTTALLLLERTHKPPVNSNFTDERLAGSHGDSRQVSLLAATFGCKAMERARSGSSEVEIAIDNLIRVDRLFALSTLFHLAVLVVLSAIAGSAGTGPNQLTPPDVHRLTVKLTADLVNVDVKQPSSSIIDASVASVSTEVLSDSLAANGGLPGPSLIALPVDIYCTASEVDVQATPVTAIELETEEVRMLPLNAIGRVVLKLWIDQSGKVEKIFAACDKNVSDDHGSGDRRLF
jgi:hypothetical protein